MIDQSESLRAERLGWLLELAGLPTATGREDAVVAWVCRWAAARPMLTLTRDPAGNLLLWKRPGPEQGASPADQRHEPPRPVLFTAHMDHPAFVVEAVLRDDDALAETGGETALRLSFRGGVLDPYFRDARIVVHARGEPAGRALPGTIIETGPQDPTTGLRECLAELDGHVHADAVTPGDIATWDLPAPEPRDGLVHAQACDDLAGVAAALAALDDLLHRPTPAPVGVLLTRAEEVGFIGAIAACKQRTIPHNAHVLALETSRAFVDSPIGAGPIVRVGDRAWTFSPTLTGAVAKVCERLEEHRRRAGAPFRWQRKLMPGGTCEATCYGAYGFDATCLCLPLGNYHNMGNLDAVQAGDHTSARLAPETVSIEDFHGLIDALAACGMGLEQPEPLSARMDRLYTDRSFVLSR